MKEIHTSEEALAHLKEGNRRFVNGNLKQKDYKGRRKETANAQHPHSVIFSCIDSRSAAEQFFDVTIGEIFNIRMAGNALDDHVLASMEFATEVAGSKLIAVIGHSDCGGVKGAIGSVDIGHLGGLVKDIKPAIEQVPTQFELRSTDNKEFVAAVTRRHIQNVTEEIKSRSDIINKQVKEGEVQVVGGIHELSTGEVTFFE